MAEKLKKPLQEWTSATYKIGHDETTARLKTKIDFNLADKEALKVLNSQNLFWIGEYYNEHARSEIANSMNKLLTEGASRQQVAKDMAAVLGKQTKQSDKYFSDFAQHTANRLRNMGAIAAMEKSTAVSAEVVAILDDRTSDICSSMNGRVIPIATLTEVKQQILDIKTEGRSVEEVKNDLKKIVPFWKNKDTASVANMNTDQLIADHPGLSLPPYHWKCRTRIFTVIKEEINELPTVTTSAGKAATADTKKRIGSLTNHELYNKVGPIMGSKKLKFNPVDLHSDMDKHAAREFGLTSKADYVALANRARTSADYISARSYKGQLQFTMYSKAEQAMVVVGENGVIRGCYGHKKGETAILQAMKHADKDRVKIAMEAK